MEKRIRKYLEEHPEAKIEIVDSRSASCGQMLIAVKLKELKEKGYQLKAIRMIIHNGNQEYLVSEENLEKGL